MNTTKISSLVERQLPQYMITEYPKFVRFLEVFYEYLEQEGYAIDLLISQQKYDDIDTTLDKFIPYFKQQYAQNFPDVALVNKRLIIKHIKDFYLTKGSEESFRIFFRMIYGIDIDMKYPSDNVLRTSDGVWDKKIVVRVSRTTGDPFLFSGTTFEFIDNSNNVIKKAFCESVQSFTISNLLVYELVLKTSDVDFNYSDIESATKIRTVIGTDTIIATLYYMAVDTVINNRGTGYAVGDVGTIIGVGEGGSIQVGSVDNSNGSITRVDIMEFGVGYVSYGEIQFAWGTNNMIWTNLGTPYNLTTSAYLTGLFGGDGDGDGQVSIIIGKMAIYRRQYSGTSGWLSSNMKLQDNYYYQIHSYVIGSSISYDQWIKSLKDNVHISGSIAFSEVVLNNIHQI